MKIRSSTRILTAEYKSPSLDYSSFKHELIDHIFNVVLSSSLRNNFSGDFNINMSRPSQNNKNFLPEIDVYDLTLLSKMKQ